MTKKLSEAQAYFWSAEWQADEREAQADIDARRIKRFETVEDLIAELDSEDRSGFGLRQPAQAQLAQVTNGQEDAATIDGSP
jgi:hypothetical protein